METAAQLHTKLKSSYFDFISRINENSCDHLWTNLMMKLKLAVNANDTAIYLYDPVNKRYRLESELEAEAAFLAESMEVVELKQIKPLKSGKQYFIPIEHAGDQTAILYIAFDHQYTNETLHMIKTETENVFRIISRCITQQTKENHEKNLAEIASHLLSFTRKEDILNEVTKFLKNLYPLYWLQLLLTQDFDQELDLPVEKIEYSEEGTIGQDVKAFISGKVQLERDDDGHNICVNAPLTGSQGVYGVFKMTAEQNMHISGEEAAFIAKVIDTTGKAMEKAILYENSAGLVADLKLINDATHALNSNLKLGEIINYVRDQIMEICRATQVGFILDKDEKQDNYDIFPGSTAFFNTKKGKQFAKTLMADRNNYSEAVFSSCIKEDKRFNYRSVMVIPMQHAEEMYGYIAILHEDHNYFSFDMFKLLEALIRHSNLALANALLTGKLERAVITDYLTNLYSRSYLEEEITKQQRGTLILFDIDDFKVINDTYGHHIGDEVLKQAAEIICSFTDSKDVAARWGGEELALYAPNISVSQGVQIAGLILKKVNNETNPSVTLSSGVSSWDHTQGDSVMELFIRADKALYEAKNKGKNSVMKK